MQEGSGLARFKNRSRVQDPEDFNQFCNRCSPSRLVTCSESCAVIAVEVLIKENVVAPVRISLEFLGSSVHGPTAMLIPKKYSNEPIRDLLAHLEQVHQFARTCRTFNFEIVSVVSVKGQETPHEKNVNWHPHRPPPIGIATKHAGVGLSREITHPVLLSSGVEDVGIFFMKF